MKFFVAIVLVTIILDVLAFASPYTADDEDILDEYNGQVGPVPLDKRSCIRRSGTCDGRPKSCCADSTCRCNLWGTNCRCERAGLFQKWGKK